MTTDGRLAYLHIIGLERDTNFQRKMTSVYLCTVLYIYVRDCDYYKEYYPGIPDFRPFFGPKNHVFGKRLNSGFSGSSLCIAKQFVS